MFGIGRKHQIKDIYFETRTRIRGIGEYNPGGDGGARGFMAEGVEEEGLDWRPVSTEVWWGRSGW